MIDRELPEIPGAEGVIRRLGSWPDFHDWEVVEVLLRRDDTSHVVLQSPSRPPVVVTLSLQEILDLELADFSVQNVVGSVHCEKTERGFRVNLSPLYGIGGYVEARGLFLGVGGGKLRRCTGRQPRRECPVCVTLGVRLAPVSGKPLDAS